ncbi:MAG: tRNA preQ1(34) S-adenosylmethionine ribosyltransferase-isomerase QueA [Gammaproteobacteria bacterium]|nr:tRNA preQ1(34) S-adenosylmethionine ribosyltransferase-isomerase QueA [Gammaproteobacteria bacterium]
MTLDAFDYALPAELIAMTPSAERTASRLLVIDPDSETLHHEYFSTLSQYLQPGDCVVLNDTRVLRARLFGTKRTGGRVEVLIERVLDDERAVARARANRPVTEGTEVVFGPEASATCVAREGEYAVLQFVGASPLDVMRTLGHVPLPPYIDREDGALDDERYQTVYAKNLGAIAAPTAGLHFDEAFLSRLEAHGVGIEMLTLHVGSGTFQPLRHNRVDANTLHSEHYEVSAALCERINQVKAAGRRVVAVGTTSVRALEAASTAGVLRPTVGQTNLFIRPGYRFRTVDAMVTNFHLPKSSLMMLVSAFAGHRFTMAAYRAAVAHRYRFFSYGDAMFITGRATLDANI